MSAGTSGGRARLPAIPPVSDQDPSLRTWMQAVTERLEVREGARGDDLERVVTRRDLEAAMQGQPVGVDSAPWWSKYRSLDDLADALRNTTMHADLVRRIKNSTDDLQQDVTIDDTASGGTTGGISDPPPDALRLYRNDLDFYRLPTVTSQLPSSYQEFVCTVNVANFFVQGGDHVIFALDCSGGAGTSGPHSGPIYRNDANLFVLARGFIVTGTGVVYAEHWNGTFSPGLAQVTSSVSGFNPKTTPIFTVRIVAGYRTGALANHMAITIHRGGGTGQVLFAGSVPWGWDWSGAHSCYVGAIAMGFVSPNQTGGVETYSPGVAPNATIDFSGAKLTIV